MTALPPLSFGGFSAEILSLSVELGVTDADHTLDLLKQLKTSGQEGDDKILESCHRLLQLSWRLLKGNKQAAGRGSVVEFSRLAPFTDNPLTDEFGPRDHYALTASSSTATILSHKSPAISGTATPGGGMGRRRSSVAFALPEMPDLDLQEASIGRMDMSGNIPMARERLMSIQSLAGGHDVAENSIQRDDDVDDDFEMINDYMIVEEIGRGATGKVRLAIKEGDGSMMAIKTIRQTKNFDLSAIKEEIAIMKKMRHKNIVPLLEVIHDPEESEVHLIMPRISGGPLVNVGRDGCCAPLPLRKVQWYMRQLLAAVHYLHNHRVCHGDIKPANILVTEEGTVFVADFGSAAVFHSNDVDVKQPQGTPLFTAPEVLFPEEDINLEDAKMHESVTTSGGFLTSPSAKKSCHMCAFGSGRRLSSSHSGPTKEALDQMFREMRAKDMWAVGITMYLLAYGEPPFDVGFIRDASIRAAKDGKSKMNQQMSAKFQERLDTVHAFRQELRDKQTEDGTQEGDSPTSGEATGVTCDPNEAAISVTEMHMLELLELMLQWSPKDRCNVQAARAHPFICAASKERSQSRVDSLTTAPSLAYSGSTNSYRSTTPRPRKDTMKLGSLNLNGAGERGTEVDEESPPGEGQLVQEVFSPPESARSEAPSHNVTLPTTAKDTAQKSEEIQFESSTTVAAEVTINTNTQSAAGLENSCTDLESTSPRGIEESAASRRRPAGAGTLSDFSPPEEALEVSDKDVDKAISPITTRRISMRNKKGAGLRSGDTSVRQSLPASPSASQSYSRSQSHGTTTGSQHHHFRTQGKQPSFSDINTYCPLGSADMLPTTVQSMGAFTVGTTGEFTPAGGMSPAMSPKANMSIVTSASHLDVPSLNLRCPHCGGASSHPEPGQPRSLTTVECGTQVTPLEEQPTTTSTKSELDLAKSTQSAFTNTPGGAIPVSNRGMLNDLGIVAGSGSRSLQLLKKVKSSLSNRDVASFWETRMNSGRTTAPNDHRYSVDMTLIRQKQAEAYRTQGGGSSSSSSQQQRQDNDRSAVANGVANPNGQNNSGGNLSFSRGGLRAISPRVAHRPLWPAPKS